MARLLIACLFAFAITPCIYSQQDTSTQNGTELIESLRTRFAPERVLSYRQARKAVYSDIDNVNGKVRLVYTGQTITTNSPPNHNFANIEHLYPQSRFGRTKRAQKKADLFHLVPVFSKVNSVRGNNPFGEIDDDETSKWWSSQRFQRDKPTADIDSFSESTNSTFEPREDFKGNVARSIFYFVTIYGDTGIDRQFFDRQLATLLTWHKNDPVDRAERNRNDAIEEIQANRNPYIDDPALVFRAFAPEQTLPDFTERRVEANADILRDGDQIDICSWNLQFFYDSNTDDNRSRLAVEQSADSEEEFKRRLTFFAKSIKQLGLPEVVALQEIENESVVKRLAEELNANHGANYKVAFVQGRDTFTEQDVAFLYKDKGLRVTANRMRGDFSNRNLFKVPSKHCVLNITKQLSDGTTKQLSIITCHLKAGRGGANETKRKKQARVINRFAKKLMDDNPKRGIIILGDMNASRSFADTSRTDAMGVLSGLETNSADDDFLDLNSELQRRDRRTHVSNRELDRIFLNGVLLDDEGLVFEQVVVRKEIVTDRQTDHFPIIATFTYRED